MAGLPTAVVILDSLFVGRDGLATRNVAQRVKEINSATGVLIPFAARKIFRVKSASTAERELFAKLATYRIRPDREFFRLPFGQAVGIVESHR